MILSISDKEFKTQWIEFLDKKQNMVMYGGYFTKIFYSTPNYTMNGLYIAFYETMHISFYQFMVDIEKQLLSTYAKLNPQYKFTENIRLSEILKQKYKITENDFSTITRHIGTTNYIKISGIWEDINRNIGISFKIF